MHTLVWLDDTTPLPPSDMALPDGLLAAGGELSIARLTEAYTNGIFPWYNAGDPVLWWSPDPRMVLSCADFKASHSLRKRLRQLARSEVDPNARVQVKLDTAFTRVIEACAGARDSQPGTWISPEIQAAYSAWHRAGFVHSIETWIDGRLMGGLYGVGLGGMFFGESMFSWATDASKIALAYLTRFLSRHGVHVIDCQQQTGHLARLGAHPISRRDFLIYVEQAVHRRAPAWAAGRLLQSGELFGELATDVGKTP